MSNAKNYVQLIGHLGQNPELHKAESGTMIAKASIATSATYKNEKGERVTSTEWHNIVCFNKRAEILHNYTGKGAQVLVTGSLRTRKYQTKEGHDRYTTEIIVNDIVLLDKKQ
jgi:single-strand DNA-binding protein